MALKKFAFKVLKKDNFSRTGIIETHRGNIHTPAFMPVGTQATVKACTIDDIKKLTEIPIRKISKFDLDKVKEKLVNIEANIEEVKNNLEHIVEYTIQYFTHLKKQYGKDKKRKTLIEEFDDLDKKKISIKNQKLYVNRD